MRKGWVRLEKKGRKESSPRINESKKQGPQKHLTFVQLLYVFERVGDMKLKLDYEIAAFVGKRWKLAISFGPP